MSFALPEALFFTGIDWAAETHAVCVMDAGGTVADQFTIGHSADGIATLIRRLARHGQPGGMPVAIEHARAHAARTPPPLSDFPGHQFHNLPFRPDAISVRLIPLDIPADVLARGGALT